ncbi:MAG: hypothetical protein PHR53_04210 [Bacteroidales bacterium]|nr:hypothetical protein [Bacteroidales bacterium]
MKHFLFNFFLVGCFCISSMNLTAQTDSLITPAEPVVAEQPAPQVAKPAPNKAKKGTKTSSFNARRLFFGGGIGGHISNSSLYFNIAPQVGYYLVNGRIFRFLPGVSFTYQYYQATDGFLQIDKNYPSNNIYGPGVFTRFFVNNFFAHAEYQYLWYKLNTKTIQDDYLLVGVGMRFPMGKRGGVTVSVLLDVLPHDKNEGYTIYDNPIVNIGFSF